MNCKNCGAMLPDCEKHCFKCGTDIFAGEPDTSVSGVEKAVSKSNSAKRKSVIIISAIIVLVGGGGTAFAITNYNSSEQKLSRTLLSAERCVSEQNYSQATIEFQKALEIEPTNVNTCLGLADSYIALGNIDDAIKVLRKGLEATGNQTIGVKLNELLTSRALETAHQHLDNKEYEAAIEQFKLAIELDSKCTDAYWGAADALTVLDKNDEAIEYLQLGFEKTDDKKFEEKIKELSVTRSLELAEKYMLENNYASAQTEFKKALAVDDKCVEAYIGIAEALAELDDINNAIDNLKLGLDRTGDEKIKGKLNNLSIFEYLKTAQKYLSERKYDPAKNEYEKAIALDDKCVDAYIGAADSYVGLGKIDKAIDNLQKGFEKTGNDKICTKLNKLKISDFTQKGRNSIKEEKYEEAISNFQKVLEIDKKNISAYIEIADAYIALDKGNDAIEILIAGFDETKDKKLNEKLTSVKRSTALALAKNFFYNGKFSEAISEFKKALDSDEKCVEAYKGMADAYFGLGNSDGALESLQNGYNKTGDESIHSRLNELSLNSSLELAREYLSQKEYSKARDEFQNVLNLDSSCVEAYLGKADAYIGLGDVSSANDALRKGWNATWDSRIQNRMSRGKLNNIPLNPQKCGYEPLNKLVEQILGRITTNDMDTYEKVKACYDYLIDTCVYGQGDGIYDVLSFEDMFNEKSLYEKFAYIILRDHEGVCDYYSAAFVALTRAIGLDTKIRGGQTSTAKTESGYTGHAWCVIIIDGVEYVFDPQVEDNIAKGGAIGYYRFCKTYDEVKNNYIPSFWVDM